MGMFGGKPVLWKGHGLEALSTWGLESWCPEEEGKVGASRLVFSERAAWYTLLLEPRPWPR